jgi:hypothetical protein
VPGLDLRGLRFETLDLGAHGLDADGIRQPVRLLRIEILDEIEAEARVLDEDRLSAVVLCELEGRTRDRESLRCRL